MAVVKRYKYEAGKITPGGQDVINLDYFKIYFQASMLIDLVDGSMEVIPEITMDDLNTTDPSAIRWLPYGETVGHQPLTLPLTASTLVHFDSPIVGVRLNIINISGEIRLTVIQGLGS